MSQFLGLGITHYPMLLSPDENMSGLLRRTLTDPDIPSDSKDPANWSEQARAEWSDDEGTAAAAVHRAALLDGLAVSRRALDEFRPDALIVWGDDQYENFREEIIPAFCVLAYGDTDVEPFGVLRKIGAPNVWGLPDDTTYTMRGAPDLAKQIVSDVLADPPQLIEPASAALTASQVGTPEVAKINFDCLWDVLLDEEPDFLD